MSQKEKELKRFAEEYGYAPLDVEDGVLTWSSKIVTPAHSIKPLWQQPVLDHH
jgi:hypothetical protein